MLGHRADEALAAAVYILTRHAESITAALSEAVNSTGRSSLIATLVGALVGSVAGMKRLKKHMAKKDLLLLENKESYDSMVKDFEHS